MGIKIKTRNKQKKPIFDKTQVFSIQDIGSVVQMVRKKNKVNQKYSALLSGVTPKFLSELENGKNKHFSLRLVLQVLNSLGIELHLQKRKIR